MVTKVDVPTGLVLNVKVAVLAPLRTVTLDGTLATLGLLLERDTATPSLGAGALSITVTGGSPSTGTVMLTRPHHHWAPARSASPCRSTDSRQSRSTGSGSARRASGAPRSAWRRCWSRCPPHC